MVVNGGEGVDLIFFETFSVKFILQLCINTGVMVN